MKVEIVKAIDELKRQFDSELTVREDGQGGAYVIVEKVQLGAGYAPSESWIGFHIASQYPYADIYPLFINSNVKRIDGKEHVAPVTLGHNFESRAAIQISRRTSNAQSIVQKATTKVLKVLAFLETV